MHQITVHEGHTQTLHQIRYGGRNADGENSQQLLFFHSAYMDGKRKLPALFQDKAHQDDICDKVSQDGCNRGASRPHSQPEDKNRIQDDIHHGADDGSDHGFHSQPFRPHQIAGRQGQNYRRRAERHIGIVLGRILPGILTRSQQMQDRRPKQQHGHRDCCPAQNRRIEAEAAYFFPFPVLFLTEQPGNHGAAAQT